MRCRDSCGISPSNLPGGRKFELTGSNCEFYVIIHKKIYYIKYIYVYYNNFLRRFQLKIPISNSSCPEYKKKNRKKACS